VEFLRGSLNGGKVDGQDGLDTDNWSFVGFGGDFITRTWDLVVQQKDFIR